MQHARAVIIGGGVGGTSIAYHLAELGWTDIVLVDRAELTSGSTFHSAGLVGQLRSSVTLTRMMMYGAGLYRRLRDETGVETALSTTGGTSDGRFIAQVCPQVIEFGPLNATIHKIDEHVAVADIEPLKNIYRRTIANLNAAVA